MPEIPIKLRDSRLKMFGTHNRDTRTLSQVRSHYTSSPTEETNWSGYTTVESMNTRFLLRRSGVAASFHNVGSRRLRLLHQVQLYWYTGFSSSNAVCTKTAQTKQALVHHGPGDGVIKLNVGGKEFLTLLRRVPFNPIQCL